MLLVYLVLVDFSLAGATAGGVSLSTILRTLKLSGLSTWPGYFTSPRSLTWSTQSYFWWRKSSAIFHSFMCSTTVSCLSTAGGGPGEMIMKTLRRIGHISVKICWRWTEWIRSISQCRSTYNNVPLLLSCHIWSTDTKILVVEKVKKILETEKESATGSV